VLAKIRKRVGPDLPIIGVGGVSSAETALEKIKAGADLVQLYSCMVYEGPSLPGAIVRGLSKLLDREKVSSIRESRDRRARDSTGMTHGLLGGFRPFCFLRSLM
jgi:dihydroorotate dehydrogenase